MFYLICGLAAGLVHYFTNADSTLPTVGASGAIAGVLGAYFLFFPSARIITLIPLFFLPLFVEIPAVTYLGFWILSQIFSGALSLGLPDDVGGVAFWAHVSGFVAGAILCWLFVQRKQESRFLAPDEWGLGTPWRLNHCGGTSHGNNRTLLVFFHDFSFTARHHPALAGIFPPADDFKN
jgi:membrane associated rhomboid family serine protease